VIRTIILIIGWLMAALALYLALTVLELWWNLNDWQPKFDARALALIVGACLALLMIGCLARANAHQIGQGVSLATCLALLALGVYVFPQEPLTQGLFARGQSSPLWYRGGRLVALASPSVLWSLGLLRRRRLAGQPGAATR
jgi:hypothetical protein